MVSVSLFNDAHVAEETLARAEQVAERIFRQSGVNLELIFCWHPKLPAREKALCQLPELSLRIVSHADGMLDDAFGAAFLGPDGTGRYADVFFDRITGLQQARPGELGIADLLGCVAAHEIGHLLGLHLHSQAGIMRARWEREDLNEVAMGALVFTRDQSQFLRERLAAQALAVEAAVNAMSSP
jgi:hypothetical protein